MTQSTAYQLLTLACLCILANGLVDFKLEQSFFDVEEDVTGVCKPSPDPFRSSTAGVLFVVTNKTVSCDEPSPGNDGKPMNQLGTVTNGVNESLSFIIDSTDLRVYNVWCMLERLQICKPAIKYSITVNETDDGFICKLELANDGGRNPKIPSAVEWWYYDTKLEGNSKDLSRDDFAGDDILTTSSIIEVESDRRKGVHECRYTVADSDQTLSASYSINNKPSTDRPITFDPAAEQYTDGDSVNMTCAFEGTPPPQISWLLNGSPAPGEDIKMGTDGKYTTSTYVIAQITADTHRGNYTCVAENSEGSTAVSKTVHARDKLAALWPFLGILAQVIVLAICIAIGEKFRKKRYAEKHRRRQMGEDDANVETRT